MKYIGENAITKLISLIKGDLATKQDSIDATGVLERDTTGVINGVETVGATLVETQEAKLVDVPNGLLKGDGTTISAAVAGTDYVNSSQAIRYDAAQSLTDEQKAQARNNIGAAPSGYGLGNEYSGYIDDFNNKVKTGWYQAYSASLNCPVEPGTGLNLAYGVLRVERRDSLIHQFYNIERYGNSISMRRISTDGGTTWGEWEYENPRMEIGVEYRTTERYLGYPVYVKLVDCGALPNAGSEKRISVSDLGILVPISMNLTWGNSSSDNVVINDSTQYISDAQFTNNLIWITSNSTVLDAYNVYALLKYSKRT